jgi:hypothetical protein
MGVTEEQKALLRAVSEWLMSSDELIGRLEAFAKEKCQAFATAATDPRSENKLEYTKLFEEYQAMFEAQLSAFLASRGTTQEAFVEACSASVQSASADVGATDLILAMTDFGEFKQLMVSTYEAKA